MAINKITDVFFDLDHTLWDFSRNSALAFEKIFKINHVQIDLTLFLAYYETINFNYWSLYRHKKIDKETLRFGRLNDTFNAVHFPLDKELVEKLSNDYINHLTDNNFLYENAIEILEYLKPKYSLHILSNGFEYIQNKKLKNSNIHHYFSTVTNGESVGVKKPNPLIFNYALQQAKTTANKSIMIGDGYEPDIQGALGVGMDVIFFDEFNSHETLGIKKINNLIELKTLL
ncbi:MAG: YjjG family noncanonical pyrimidine nucleotidase [Aestuariibaculum sp.]